jgi:hypothetical protein
VPGTNHGTCAWHRIKQKLLIIEFNWFQQLIGVEDEDFCGKSGVRETPEALAEEAPTRPRKAKSSTEINCGI